MNWILREHPRTPLWWVRPMRKCKQTRKHKKTFTIWISSWRCKYSMTRLQFHHLENSAKNTDVPTTGSAVKSHGWQKKGRQWNAKRTIFVPLVVPVLSNSGTSSSSTWPPQDSSSTPSSTSSSPASERSDEPAPGNWRDSPKTQNKKSKSEIIEHRKTDCETFGNGWRSSQIISKIQKCMHPHTVLMIQIRNVLQKWHSGSTVFKKSLPNRPKLRSLFANQNDKGSLHKTHWRSSTSGQKSLVTWWRRIT